MLGESLKISNPSLRLKLVMYSPWATISDNWLLKDLPNRKNRKPAELYDKLKKEFGLEIERTIGTDRDLLKKVADELVLRGVDVATDCVALLAEWDTLYGRVLPSTFEDIVTKRWKQEHDSDKSVLHSDCLKLSEPQAPATDRLRVIHRYSYLRGLDGELPPEGV